MHVAVMIALAVALPSESADARTGALIQEPATHRGRPDAALMAQRRTCKAASTCREAVVMWCEGYRRADADDDGIPCENVCGSRAQVDAIKQEIDC